MTKKQMNRMVSAALAVSLSLVFVGCKDKPQDKTVSHSSQPQLPDSQPSENSHPEVPVFTPAVSWEEPKAGEWNLVLVNADHPLAQDFSVTLAEYADGIRCDERILPALKAMMQAAAADGVSVYPSSGYRTLERSAYLYENQVNQWLAKGYSEEDALAEAAKWVAPPGTSEHHTGLAFDFLSNESTQMDESFASTAAAKWLYAHAPEYGFVLRYPKDKQEITGITFEPWHYRYVGTLAAAQMVSSGECLEEYAG